MLPEKSFANPLKGIWFVFNDGTNAIKIFGSIFGKEKIYVNEKLISEQLSFKLDSSHKFEDYNGNNYEVKFCVSDLLKGKMECQIKRNDELIKSFNTQYVKGKSFPKIRLIIVLTLSIGFGVVCETFKFPDFYFYCFLIAVLFLFFLSRKNGQIIIEES